VNNQQLAIVWVNKWIICASLAGFISYINPESGEISKVIKGHNKPITAMVLSSDKKFLFTADFEGNISESFNQIKLFEFSARWETKTGTSERVEPSPHKAQISGLALTPSGTLISIGWDDSIAFMEGVFGSVDNAKSEKKQLTSQPRGISVSGDLAVVIGHRHIFVFAKKELKTTVDFGADGVCIALSRDGKLVAVGSLVIFLIEKH
jgi:WD40 repeat protein